MESLQVWSTPLKERGENSCRSGGCAVTTPIEPEGGHGLGRDYTVTKALSDSGSKTSVRSKGIRVGAEHLDDSA